MIFVGVGVAYSEISSALSSLSATNTDLQQPDANRSVHSYLPPVVHGPEGNYCHKGYWMKYICFSNV